MEQGLRPHFFNKTDLEQYIFLVILAKTTMIRQLSLPKIASVAKTCFINYLPHFMARDFGWGRKERVGVGHVPGGTGGVETTRISEGLLLPPLVTQNNRSRYVWPVQTKTMTIC